MPTATANATNTVICQKWEESERGWGTRPAGYSLHLTNDDCKAFIKDHWARLPDDHIPDEYSRPDGTAYSVEVDKLTFAKVSASKNGVHFHGNPPGDGGSDGWKTVKR